MNDTYDDAALLALRAPFGGLMAGHGSQKLFGWFGGFGYTGTANWLETMGFRPGKLWAAGVSASEFGGGVLTALGLLNPIGPLLTLGSMGVAALKVHWGKPIWVTSGGAELPVTNIAIATALALAGPGKFSLDTVLGIHLPRWVVVPGLTVVAGGVGFALWHSHRQQQLATASKPPMASKPSGAQAPAQLKSAMKQPSESTAVHDSGLTIESAIMGDASEFS